MTVTEDTDYQAVHIPRGSTNWNLLIKNVQPQLVTMNVRSVMKKTVYLIVSGNNFIKTQKQINAYPVTANDIGAFSTKRIESLNKGYFYLT